VSDGHPQCDGRRQAEAAIIESERPGWAVIYGVYSRLFWAFGAPDGKPIGARSASELLGAMRAAERSQAGPHYQQGPPHQMPGTS